MTEDTAIAEMPPGKLEPLSIPRVTPKMEIELATKIANELAAIIEKKKLYVGIGKKNHVFVEGWTTLAALRGCTPLEVSNEDVGAGVYVATVELVNADGRVIGRASAECGSEPLWKGRDPNARRSMANTRATSKVCRQVFSWVMVLAGYAATPAEEMPREGFKDTPPQRENAPQKPSEAPQSRSGANWDGELVLKSGNHKDKKWKDVPLTWLNWVIENKKGPVDMCQKELARRAGVEAGGEVYEGEVVDEMNPPPPEQDSFL